MKQLDQAKQKINKCEKTGQITSHFTFEPDLPNPKDSPNFCGQKIEWVWPRNHLTSRQQKQPKSLKINVLSGSFKAPQLLYVVVIAKLRFSSLQTWKKMASQTCKEIEPLAHASHVKKQLAINQQAMTEKASDPF